MMPWTAHRLPDQEPFPERPAVVRAGGIDGEDFRAAARDEHRSVLYLPYHHAAIGKVLFRDAHPQIGPGGLGCVSHG
jgi:hypothetical protein